MGRNKMWNQKTSQRWSEDSKGVIRRTHRENQKAWKG